MKFRSLIFYVLFIGFLPAALFAGNSAKESQKESSISKILSSLSEYEVGQIDIYNLPSGVKTYQALDPEALRKSAHYKLEIRSPESWQPVADLTKAIKALKTAPDAKMSDVRWELVFFARKGKEIGSISLSRFGDTGAIGNVPVRVENQELLEFLKKKYESFFE